MNKHEYKINLYSGNNIILNFIPNKNIIHFVNSFLNINIKI